MYVMYLTQNIDIKAGDLKSDIPDPVKDHLKGKKVNFASQEYHQVHTILSSNYASSHCNQTSVLKANVTNNLSLVSDHKQRILDQKSKTASIITSEQRFEVGVQIILGFSMEISGPIFHCSLPLQLLFQTSSSKIIVSNCGAGTPN